MTILLGWLASEQDPFSIYQRVQDVEALLRREITGPGGRAPKVRNTGARAS